MGPPTRAGCGEHPLGLPLPELGLSYNRRKGSTSLLRLPSFPLISLLDADRGKNLLTQGQTQPGLRRGLGNDPPSPNAPSTAVRLSQAVSASVLGPGSVSV